ncbi:DM13 domain-containing protein [Anabaena subtropica]|uniref:DM13 domain-containing protein n=1 Tax=Anabaena subtropica FACHB-260 TaxID=2692884 RepID=A0ABR8CX97_9NOST|nr:DM13 domain-containing protein [Anabaena subtropica]MBD2347075.1 DM13 domain-containing protein [Anabaena subtropica FACHB-260]
MRCKYLIIIGLIGVLTIGCTSQTVTQTPTATTVATSDIKPGNFQAGEHPTQGQVTVVKEAETSYLEFDQNFKTDQGPDLYVILYRSAKPPISGIQEKDYVSIARLQKTSGNQRYALPKNINLQEFKSVAIWCQKFNATFGYAVL